MNNILKQYHRIERKIIKLQFEITCLEQELEILRSENDIDGEIKAYEQQKERSEQASKLKDRIFGTLYVDDDVLIAFSEVGITTLSELLSWFDNEPFPISQLNKRQINRAKKDMLSFLRTEKNSRYGMETLEGKHPIMPGMFVRFLVKFAPHREPILGYHTGEVLDFDKPDSVIIKLERPTEQITIPIHEIIGVYPWKFFEKEFDLKLLDIHELLIMELETDGESWHIRQFLHEHELMRAADVQVR